jgi:ribosomal protein L28
MTGLVGRGHALLGSPRTTLVGSGRARRARRLAGALLLFGLVLAPGVQARVYWGNYGTAYSFGRADLVGSGVNQSFVTPSGTASPYGVAVDGSHFYWVNFDSPTTIGRSNLDGTGVDQSFINLGANGADGLAVDGAHLYWSEINNHTVGRANLDGTGVNESFITGAGSPSGPAVDGAHIYWANSFSNAIGIANLDGSGVNATFIAGASDPLQVAVDGAHIFWANYNQQAGTTIGRATLAGTDVNESFITGASGAAGVGVDQGHVYWANYGTGTIGRANIDGTGVAQNFITGGNGPWYLAVGPLDTTVTAGPPAASDSGTANFSFSGSEPGGFQCELDGGAFASCISPASYTGLANGAHTFEVRATDTDGNLDPTPASAAWTVSVATPGPVGPGTGPAASAPRKASFAGSKSSIGVNRKRRFAFSFHATPGLTGTAVFQSVKAVSASRKHKVTLVKKALVVPASGHVTLKIRLSATAFRILKLNGKIRTRVTVTLKNGAGRTSKASDTVTLRAPT